MTQDSSDLVRIDAELRQAVACQAFEIYYQPVIGCADGRLLGLEALLRWHHPERGLREAEEFLPGLEDNGLIVEVGRWVLAGACRQMQDWLAAGLAGAARLAVNISVYQFAADELVGSVRQALADSGLPAGRLELEITEPLLMQDVERVLAVLQELSALGVHLTIDDFGTGYSSLTYLRRFPVGTIKIDRSLVQDVTVGSDEASVTRAVIGMAHNLQLRVIAEGVETERQLAQLLANQCDAVQGYYFCRPLPAAEMAGLLADPGRLPALPSRPQPRQRTLLLVDDEENILAALRRLLRRDGYRILTANSGQAGLDLLASEAVDVILSDQRMPAMTGVEFLRQVKARYPDTVRLVLSGYTELQSITDAINEGAIYKFLTKPWDDELLRANLEEAFRYKELADENRRLNLELQVVNRQLARANERLLDVLAEKERRILRDETTLDVAQEVLHCIPFPVLGIDDEAMIVFANVEAERVLGNGLPLFGANVDERLVPPLAGLLDAPDGKVCDWEGAGRRWRALCRVLGRNGQASGRLLILHPSCQGD